MENMSEIERLRAYAKHCQDLALQHYGLLLCIQAWMLGELPEANAPQFIEQIEASHPPDTSILAGESEAQ